MSVKFVFNCSTNVVGGAVQNSVNFIKSIYSLELDHDWYFVLSNEVYKQIADLVTDNFSIFSTPASSLQSRKEIRSLVKKIDPSLVYTSAGPAYIDFHCFHVMGCSNPYVLGANKYALSTIGSFKELIVRKARTMYQRYYIKRANFWLLQTEYSQSQFCRIKDGKCNSEVVYNSVSSEFMGYFEGLDHNLVELNEVNKPVKVLFPSSYYSHKNFEIIPDLIRELKDRKFDIEVSLTVKSGESVERIFKRAVELGVECSINNLGPYEHSQALGLYLSHDIIIQPSLLEVFSTSYIEAMAVVKPLVIPDLPFSRDICKDYGHYFFPDSVESMSFAIQDAIRSLSSKNSYFERFNIATEILSKYGSQEQRFKQIYQKLILLDEGRRR